MTSNSPASRWTREHGFRRGGTHPSHQRRRARGGKIVHRTYWHARWACWRTSRHDRDLRPYACQWGPRYESGEVYPRHWHIGHTPRTDWWGY